VGALRGWSGTSASTGKATATTVGWDRAKQELHRPRNIEELTLRDTREAQQQEARNSPL